MSELQVGMLALVISAYNPENIGSIVETIRLVTKGEPLPEMGEHQTASISGWLISGNIKTTGGHIGLGVSKPEWLMPIKPESDPLDVTHKEELHA
jgi:hypothetical protein